MRRFIDSQGFVEFARLIELHLIHREANPKLIKLNGSSLLEIRLTDGRPRVRRKEGWETWVLDPTERDTTGQQQLLSINGIVKKGEEAVVLKKPESTETQLLNDNSHLSTPLHLEASVSFEQAPSRPVNTPESWSLYHFEMHARGCSYCQDPYEVYTKNQQLCRVGNQLAQDATRFVHYKDINGEDQSIGWDDNQLHQLANPTEYEQAKGLLNAMVRSSGKFLFPGPNSNSSTTLTTEEDKALASGREEDHQSIGEVPFEAAVPSTSSKVISGRPNSVESEAKAETQSPLRRSVEIMDWADMSTLR